MSRVSNLVPIAAAAVVLASAGLATAQDAGSDPIADALTSGDSPDLPKQQERLTAQPHAFSPGAISDLLRQDAAREAAADVPPGATTADSAKASRALNPQGPLTPDVLNNVRFGRVNPNSKSIDPVVLKAEILLDRAHAPPGVIDGRFGSNFAKAIRTFETVRGLPVDGKLTRQVWDELGGDTAAPVLGVYTIKPADVVGPFYPDLSPDYAEEAKMPDLGYRSPEEMFGERFHMDKRFLKALNPGVDMMVPGSQIIVAEIETMPIAAQIARIDVDKGKGQVLAYDRDGNLVVAYPATIGSEELPSPSGSYVVRGIAPHPTYTYDPKKNFQQGSNTQKLVLPPGPNNPVGAAFIALSKPTFGIHGTPDPTKIDKTHSHGCVRLTNWNAQELARLVQVGVPVNFIEKPGADPGAAEPDIASLLGADPAGVR